MGNDGGSIPTRRELVKSAARNPTHSEVRDSQAESKSYRWKTCPLSKRKLLSPVVSDSAGRLYNKDSIIEWLLRKTEAFGDGEEILEGRVNSLKDVLQVKFQTADDAHDSASEPSWVCPISQKELGPGVKTVYIVPCGHAFSESALKEVSERNRECITCDEPYDESDIIPVNSVDKKDIERLDERRRLLKERGLTHTLKKATESKKSKKRKNTRKADPEELSSTLSKKSKAESIQNSATVDIMSRGLEDEKTKSSQRRLKMSENLRSLFTDPEAGADRNHDFMNRGFTLPADRKT